MRASRRRTRSLSRVHQRGRRALLDRTPPLPSSLRGLMDADEILGVVETRAGTGGATVGLVLERAPTFSRGFPVGNQAVRAFVELHIGRTVGGGRPRHRRRRAFAADLLAGVRHLGRLEPCRHDTAAAAPGRWEISTAVAVRAVRAIARRMGMAPGSAPSARSSCPEPDQRGGACWVPLTVDLRNTDEAALQAVLSLELTCFIDDVRVRNFEQCLRDSASPRNRSSETLRDHGASTALLASRPGRAAASPVSARTPSACSGVVLSAACVATRVSAAAERLSRPPAARPPPRRPLCLRAAAGRSRARATRFVSSRFLKIRFPVFCSRRFHNPGRSPPFRHAIQHGALRKERNTPCGTVPRTKTQAARGHPGTHLVGQRAAISLVSRPRHATALRPPACACPAATAPPCESSTLRTRTS